MSGVESVPWVSLKSLLSSIPLDFSYVQTEKYYYIYTSGRVILVCGLPRDSGDEVTDFETNYKSSAINFSYEEINLFQNITGNGTTVVKSGAGFLRAITINNNATGGTLTVYDNTLATGTKIALFQIGSPSGGILSSSGLSGPVALSALDIRFNIGLTVVTTGSTSNNVTVFYR